MHVRQHLLQNLFHATFVRTVHIGVDEADGDSFDIAPLQNLGHAAGLVLCYGVVRMDARTGTQQSADGSVDSNDAGALKDDDATTTTKSRFQHAARRVSMRAVSRRSSSNNSSSTGVSAAETPITASKLATLRSRLESSTNDEEMRMFVRGGKLRELMYLMNILASKREKTFLDVSAQLTVIKCFRAIMNTEGGLDAVIKQRT